MKMKKLWIALTAALSIVATSCNEMDTFPHNAVSPDNITTEDTELLLTGLYFYTAAKPTTDGYLTNDIVGGEIVRGAGAGIDDPVLLVHGLVVPAGGFVSGPWNGYLTCLHQINLFIKQLDSYPAGTKRNEMYGTASFFRGLVYYELVSRYSEVPIIEVPTKDAVANATEAEGWAFVERNFQAAIDNCPDFSDKNYVSRQAAKALMARTKLAMGKKAEAAALAEELINDGRFALADFDEIFRDKANKEEIFTFSNRTDESGLKRSASFYTRIHPNGGSGTYAPTQAVMDMFDDDDKRKAISVDMQGSNRVINKFDGGEVESDPIIITRLAEMYLIAAEGKGLTDGLARLNELRKFRGLGPVAPANDEEFLTAVLNERRLELLGEGFRWFDLVRTGRLEKETKLESQYNKLPIPTREMTLNKLLHQNAYWK